MSIPQSLLPTTCDIYRPFGAATPLQTGVACRLVPDLNNRDLVRSTGLFWTHYIDLSDSIDIRDGVTRTVGVNNLTYADGDEVRIPHALGSRYVVVWVEMRNRGDATQYQRAYLLRHEATWPGP